MFSYQDIVSFLKWSGTPGIRPFILIRWKRTNELTPFNVRAQALTAAVFLATFIIFCGVSSLMYHGATSSMISMKMTLNGIRKWCTMIWHDITRTLQIYHTIFHNHTQQKIISVYHGKLLKEKFQKSSYVLPKIVCHLFEFCLFGSVSEILKHLWIVSYAWNFPAVWYTSSIALHVSVKLVSFHTGKLACHTILLQVSTNVRIYLL